MLSKSVMRSSRLLRKTWQMSLSPCLQILTSWEKWKGRHGQIRKPEQKEVQKAEGCALGKRKGKAQTEEEKKPSRESSANSLSQRAWKSIKSYQCKKKLWTFEVVRTSWAEEPSKCTISIHLPGKCCLDCILWPCTVPGPEHPWGISSSHVFIICV